MCNFAKKCMSLLAYFVERASLCAFFMKPEARDQKLKSIIKKPQTRKQKPDTKQKADTRNHKLEIRNQDPERRNSRSSPSHTNQNSQNHKKRNSRSNQTLCVVLAAATMTF